MVLVQINVLGMNSLLFQSIEAETSFEKIMVTFTGSVRVSPFVVFANNIKDEVSINDL